MYCVMMITFLSGGTGTPKLIQGARRLMNDSGITVVVNTAEDMWFGGGHLSPDVDTIMYLFAGLLDTTKWWGIEDDTYATHDFIETLGEDEFIAIGDRDRAVLITRAAMLSRGRTLTEATHALCRSMRVDARVLPMCDTEVTTVIQADDRCMHFQEYWVRHRGAVAIREIRRECATAPVATDEVLHAIEKSDAVVIGPSNPVTSVSPILECKGVREALRDQYVVAVSPFIGDAPVSGPAAALMRAWNRPPTSEGTFELYRDFVDLFVQDIRDTEPIDGAVQLDTLMVDEEKSMELAEAILAIIDRRR
jgi:LPPG:FO 2-phospho-L-lactate transferase